MIEAPPLHHAERDAFLVYAGVLVRLVRGVQVSHDGWVRVSCIWTI